MDIRLRRTWARLSGIVLVLAFSALAAACTPVIGWGVVLWSTDAKGIDAQGANALGADVPGALDGLDPQAASPSPGPGSSAAAKPAAASPGSPNLSIGQIVPVYVKSAIQKVYIVGIPSSGRKAEIAQWRIEFFPSKSKAKAFLKLFEPTRSLWALATRDGLPVRAKPETAGDRVYRLQEKEVVKIIKKTSGEVVKTGDQALEGDWYQVLCGDGTRGFAFSNTLTMFDTENQTAAQAAAGSRADRDDSIDLILSKTWRPEIFKTMIQDGHYDLDEFSMRYGMFSDLTKKQIRLELPALSEVFNYDEAVKLRANLYGFTGTSLQIQARGDDLLTLSFPDENGKTKAIVLVLVEDDMEALSRAEESRRQQILEGILSRGSTLASDTYGEISLTRSRRFTWKGYELLTPGVVPGGLGESGELLFDRYVDEDLAGTFSGVLNFKFDLLPKEDSVRFYYSLSPEGLRLEQMPPDAFDPTGLVAQKRAAGAVVAFFGYRE
jgi:hypothetical protein